MFLIQPSMKKLDAWSLGDPVYVQNRNNAI